MLSGLFAGSETGMYQMSRVRLRLGVGKKRFLYVVLGKVMGDSTGLLLSMLIGTNLAHYLATSTITYIFFTQVGPDSAEAMATAVAVPVLFVFSELIPKNIFFYRADVLMPYSAPVLLVFHKAFTWCGAVPVLRFISSVFSHIVGLKSSSQSVITSSQRHRVRAILQDTHEEGVLSSVQKEIIDRIVGIPSLRIRSVMIPMHLVQAVNLNSDRQALLEVLKKCAFTRLCVYDGHAEDVVGFINIYEVLSLPEDFEDLRKYIKPIRQLPGDMAVTDAIAAMQTKGHKIVLVTRSGRGAAGRPIGIVTMKDLAEELLGELVEW